MGYRVTNIEAYVDQVDEVLELQQRYYKEPKDSVYKKQYLNESLAKEKALREKTKMYLNYFANQRKMYEQREKGENV